MFSLSERLIKIPRTSPIDQYWKIEGRIWKNPSETSSPLPIEQLPSDPLEKAHYYARQPYIRESLIGLVDSFLEEGKPVCVTFCRDEITQLVYFLFQWDTELVDGNKEDQLYKSRVVKVIVSSAGETRVFYSHGKILADISSERQRSYKSQDGNGKGDLGTNPIILTENGSLDISLMTAKINADFTFHGPEKKTAGTSNVGIVTRIFNRSRNGTGKNSETLDPQPSVILR